MVEAKPGIAFVEFEGENQATVALSGRAMRSTNHTHGSNQAHLPHLSHLD